MSANETHVKWALIKAVKNHDKTEVERLIAARVDVNETDDQRQTALLYAVKNNVELEVIRALVQKGKASINAEDRSDRSSLFYALTKSKETASYLFKEAGYFNESSVPSILSYFLESLCTKMYDSHPTIDEVLLILRDKGLEPRNLANELAKSIVNILLCKLPLLLTSDIECHRSSNTMFHLHGKRKSFLDILKKITECECMENYARKESIKEVLKKIEDRRENISDILRLLKEHSPDPKFADSYGNTALHYAACLPWLGAPQETIKEICRELLNLGVPLNKTNHQDLDRQTPLLFCLSGGMGHLEESDKLAAMRTLVEVCEFLVKRGSRLLDTTTSGESVFHLVVKLFQQGFKIPDRTIRQGVADETMKLLNLFSPLKMGKVARNRAGDLQNSPLHLWATLTVPVQEYTCFVTRELTFKKLLKDILTHLLKCGASKNDRNSNEETPLHVCNTWTAVNLLIDVKAHPNDVDSSKRTPLLVAASKQTFLKCPSKEKSRFYPDVHQEAKPFFEMAVEKKLDPWTADTNDESVLSFLIASEIYDLSKALVEVACNLKEKDKSQKIFVSLLKAICKDGSLNTIWKTDLAGNILSCCEQSEIDGVVSEPFDICCKTISELSDLVNNEQPSSNNETSEDLERKKIENTVHCSIAKVLRKYGAELSGASYEALKTKCKEIGQILQDTEVKKLVPWTSRSKTHKYELHQVARLQEYQKIGESVYCHRSPAGWFGADIFVGINKQNSREVAVKKKRIGEKQCTQDLKKLYAHLDCEQIIVFFHLEGDNSDHVYIVFELMEGNLDHYLGSDAFDSNKGASLCGDIIKGLNYLHKHKINHYQDHLKPTSIFYKIHPKLCLKITDFDHNQPADGTSTYVCSSPEVQNHKKHSNSSDVFSCGLLLHYILSVKKHPFAPRIGARQHETEINILNGNMEGWDDSLCTEAAHLLKAMLDGDESKRPSADKALDHPFFWSNKKKLDLLFAVGNQPEIECPRARRTLPLTAVETDLDTSFGTIVEYGDWNDSDYDHMPTIYTEMTRRRRRYDTRSVVELVRLIRNAYAHVSESTRPTPIRKQLLEDFVFLEYFPNLVIEVYKAVTTHGWDQNREEIKYAMKYEGNLKFDY